MLQFPHPEMLGGCTLWACFLLDLWLGHLEGPSEGSFSNCALGAQGCQGEITGVRGRAIRRVFEPSSLPSARLAFFFFFFSFSFLLYCVVWKLLLWWKDLDSLAPWLFLTFTSDLWVSLFRSLFLPLPVVARDRDCWLPLLHCNQRTMTLILIVIWNGKGAGWVTRHLDGWVGFLSEP